MKKNILLLFIILSIIALTLYSLFFIKGSIDALTKFIDDYSGHLNSVIAQEGINYYVNQLLIYFNILISVLIPLCVLIIVILNEKVVLNKAINKKVLFINIFVILLNVIILLFMKDINYKTSIIITVILFFDSIILMTYEHFFKAIKRMINKEKM